MIRDMYISLYDYLGKPAGADLGKQVEAAARLANIPKIKREVSTNHYTGQVNTYPQWWLQEYFSTITT